MDDEKVVRTYSPMAVLAGFLVVGVIGLALLIFAGASERTPTEQVATDDTVVIATSTSTTPSPATTAGPLTFPDGSPVPEDITGVLSEPGSVTYTYAVPPELTGTDSARAVAPTLIEPANDGTALAVTVTCAVSTGSVPAEIHVVEDPLEIRVTVVAAGKRLGQPCQPFDVIETVTVPLEAAIGQRQILATPPGTPL